MERVGGSGGTPRAEGAPHDGPGHLLGRSAESVGDIQGEVETEAARQPPAGQQLVSGCGVAVRAVVDEEGREDRPDGQGDGPPGLDVVRVGDEVLVGEGRIR